MNKNIYAILAQGFPKDETRPFLILPDGTIHSYRDLDRQTARFANLLTACGLQPGDRVAAQVDKSPAALFLYLGCVRAGFVYVPINSEYPRNDIEYFLNDAEAGVFVCRPDIRQDVAEMAGAAGVKKVFDLGSDGSGTLVEEAAPLPTTFTTADRAADDLAAIMYTSGTTGRSKGAMLSHGNLSSNAVVLHAYWGFRPGDVILHALPIYHTHGLFVAPHCAMLNGGAMLFEPRFDAKRVLQLLPLATVFMGVPPNYAALLDEPGMDREACARIRLFISGSAPLLPTTFKEFQRRTGHTILERYGMTEGGMLVSNPLEGERRHSTVGFPLPGTKARVVDDQGNPVPVGVIGHVQVSGPNLFSGYWRMLEKTREEHTPDGFFKTGDVGYLDADGYLSIVGRFKDLITTGGREVYPKEIETAIDVMPGVIESAVIGVNGPHGGATVAAVIARRSDAHLTADGIIAALAKQLPEFKLPKTVHFVDRLPRNGMGKVQKNILREQYCH